MTNSSFHQTWQRILGAINAPTDSALAQFLGITPAGVSSVKKKQKIPASWFDKICAETGVSRSWLMGTEQPLQPGPLPSLKQPSSEERPGRSQRKPAPRTRSFDVAAIISQAIEILESKTEYAESLENIIHALHRAMLTEKQMDSLSSEMLETFAAFQKRQKPGQRS